MSPRFLLKLLIAIVVVVALGYLFVRSLHDTRTAPYTVSGAHLRGWQLGLNEASRGNEPLLLLQPPRQLMSSLSRQIFTRAMESQSVPPVAGLPILLRSEFERAFAGQVTPGALLEAARRTGIESGAVQPRCLAVRRVSRPGETRQLYFVHFEAPDLAAIRATLSGLVDVPPAAEAFDPAAFSPTLIVAASDADFASWLPLATDPGTDCVAPIAVE